MAQTSHEALGQGLKLYTDAMRRADPGAPRAAMPNNWWEQGVLRAVSRQQADNLKRERDRNPGRPPGRTTRAGPLPPDRDAEPGRLRHGLSEVSGGGLVPQRRSAGAQRLGASRSGDILVDDAEFALNAMARLLAMAELPEAEEVEAIRKRVLHIEDEPAPGHRARTSSGDTTGRGRARFPTGGRSASRARASAIRDRSTRGYSPPRSGACSPAPRARSTSTRRSSSPTPTSPRTSPR